MIQHSTPGLRCPLGTCKWCDAKREAERELRCPSQPEPLSYNEIAIAAMVIGLVVWSIAQRWFA